MAQTTLRLSAKFPWWWGPLFVGLRIAAGLGWRPREPDAFAARLVKVLAAHIKFHGAYPFD